MSRVRSFLPKAPASLQELAALFWEYRKNPHPEEHHGFVLKTARLARGLSTEQMGMRGFSRNMIGALEAGRLVRGRRDFRRIALMYGVPYRPLADAYVQTVYPRLNLRKLGFYRQPFFIDQRDAKRMAEYLRATPTAGERISLARLERDWSAGELAAATQWHESNLSELENNRCYPEVKQIIVLCKILGIPLDEFLTLLQKTYFPNLDHPRLEKEPIPIIRGERGGDPEKLEIYAAGPGSLGEEIFFRRKRLYWSQEELGQKTSIKERRLATLEYNRSAPTQDEIVSLAQALGVLEAFLRITIGRTTFRPVGQSTWKRVRTEGGIDLSRILKRPRPIVFQTMVRKLGVSAWELAAALNAKFSPGIDLTRYRSYTGRPIYVSDQADVERLQYYETLDDQSLGEVLFFGRKDLTRNWTTGEAAERLRVPQGDIRGLEMNVIRPSDDLLARAGEKYQLSYRFLDERRTATFSSH